ncbi:MAG: CvpA family protein [Clostridia bacterium]|nr:CvpA family protein [Clostridia bacterium]
MNGALLFLVIAIYLLICVAVGLARGFINSAARTVLTILSAVIAVVTTLILRQNLLDEAFITDTLIPYLQEGGMQEVIDLLNLSPSLSNAILGCASAMVAPALCLVLFTAINAFLWIVYVVLAIVFGKMTKAVNKKVPVSILYAGIIGFVQGVVILSVIMIPLTAYTGIFAKAGDDIVQSGLLSEDPQSEQSVVALVDTSKQLHDSAAVKVFGAFGGKGIGQNLTSFEVQGQKTNVENEFGAIASMLGNVAHLTETEMANYSEREAQCFTAIVDAFDHSVMLPSITGDLIYAATDAWMNGEAFLGMEKPNMGENELFTPLMDSLLEILHADARNLPALKADIRTVADMITVFAQNGVFANMNDTDQLMTVLSGDGVVASLVNTLGANNSMKRLIPEITNLGIRAIGQALSIPEDVHAVYGDFLDDVALALNEVKGEQGATQVALLSEKLETAFDGAGVDIDAEILDFYSASLVQDLIANNENEEITAQDVQAFFAIYASYTATEIEGVEAENKTEALGFEADALAALLIGTVYENKTEDELKNSAVAVFADLCKKLSVLEQDEDFAANASQIVTDTFTVLLGEESEVLAHLQSVELTKPVSTETIANTASLQSSDEMNTTVVTLDAILIDTTKASESINEDTLEGEVNAISSIFNAATDLVGADTENMDLNTVAGSVGNILDSLSQSQTYGSEKTADLFSAVFQSETVRNAAGLDMKTATSMANKATEGDVNYTDTLTSVSNSMDVLKSLENEDGTLNEEELAEIIEGLTPQTAGMMEVYVTADRLIGFGIPEKYAPTSAELIVSMFSYMGREDLPNYNAEARALNQVLNLAMAAKNSEGGKPVFSTAPGAGDGRLPTENETMEILMASHAITYAVKDVLTDGTQVTVLDPFGIGSQIGGAGSEGEQKIVDAINDYLAAHADADRLALEGIAALFGIAIDL